MRFRDRYHRQAVFYRAMDSTIKALSRDPNLRFVVGTDAARDNRQTVRCRQVPLFAAAEQVAAMRGSADQAAVRRRFGVAFSEIVNAGSAPRQAFHERMEQVRAEVRAARRLAGVAGNLAARQTPLPSHDPVDAVVLHVSALLGAPGRGRLLADARLSESVDACVAGIAGDIDDAAAFHRHIHALADLLGLDAGPPEAANAERRDRPDGQCEDGTEPDVDAATADTAAVRPGGAAPVVTPASDYRVYDRSGDQEVTPGDLATAERLAELRGQLDAELRAERISLAHLAGRLNSVLLASVPTEREQDFDDGDLDIDRLDRRIVDPLYPLVFKRQREQPNRDTVVTFLVDNSGSMRGRPIAVAAMCADMLSRTLERCGIAVEVLGYTTRFWRGGPVQQRWSEQGRPPFPGRLNALRHIVYKSAETPWRRVRTGFALMLDDDLLKENIDGEAVEWAFRRLAMRPERRRILMVISDGAPRDEATSLANGDDYLARHLANVTAALQRAASIETVAIGIGHDVSTLYRRAALVPSEASLGSALVTKLCGLLDPAGAHSHRAMVRGAHAA